MYIVPVEQEYLPVESNILTTIRQEEFWFIFMDTISILWIEKHPVCYLAED